MPKKSSRDSSPAKVASDRQVDDFTLGRMFGSFGRYLTGHEKSLNSTFFFGDEGPITKEIGKPPRRSREGLKFDLAQLLQIRIIGFPDQCEDLVCRLSTVPSIRSESSGWAE